MIRYITQGREYVWYSNANTENVQVQNTMDINYKETHTYVFILIIRSDMSAIIRFTIRYCSYASNQSTMEPIISHLNLGQTHIHYFVKIHINIIPLSTDR